MFVSKLKSSAKRCVRSEDGGVMPLIGVACVAMIATMGLAIDAGRAALVYAKLLTSADASGLAVGARLNSTDLNAEAAKFVAGNFPKGYAGATIKNVTATANADGSIITVNASVQMPTTLLRLVGVETVDLNVTSEVTRAVSGLELVLALDNTGSMYGSKLASLKTASKDLLDIVFGDDNVADDLYVGLVPFSQAVNIGPSRISWTKTNSVKNLDWGTTTWAGCVEERTGGRDTTDQPPAVNGSSSSANATRFSPYYWPDDPNNDWKTTSNGKSTYNIAWYRGPNLFCPDVVTPMTTTKSTVVNAVDRMTAVGNTHINLGAVWAWRMISPRWRGYWGGEMTTYKLPLDYNTPRMNKAVVIMTDGDNTMSEEIYTAYNYLSKKRLGTDDEGKAEAELDNRLLKVCNSMKNSGIIIYTVAFGKLAKTTEDLLRSCATQSEYYFSSPTAEQLNIAFKTIGDSLANLRVSR